jgi:hypothetical protein
LRVTRDPSSGGYETLPEGTPLSDCPFLAARDLAPYEGGSYKLAKITFDGQQHHHEWYFVNEREAQEAYNFEFKYLDEASEKPLLTRTYILPRADYAAVTEGTADTTHTDLHLIAQEQVRVDDPIVDSLFVVDRRTYTTLPGVTMVGGQYGDRLSIPREFLADLETETEEQKVLPGTPPDKGDRVIESTIVPDTKNLSVRKTEKVKEGTLPVTTVGYDTDRDGQLVTVTRTLDIGAQTITPSATVEGSVDPKGGGLSLKEHREVPEVFPGKSFSKEKPDLVPQQFRGAVPTETEEETVAGTAAEPTLAAGELAKTEQQLTKFTKRTRKTTRDTTTLPATLTDTIIDNDGVAVTRAITLASGTQTLTPSATVSGQVENLGDGLTVKTQDTKAELFDEKAVTKTKPDNTPPKFQAEVEQLEESVVVEASEANPDLANDEEMRSEQRITKHKVKRTTRKKPGVTLPVTLTGKQTGVWGEETVTEDLTTSSDITPGHTVLSHKVEPIGNGRFVGQKVQVLSPSALTERRIDPETKAEITITKTLVAAGAALPPVSGLGSAEIQPIDKWNSIQIVTSISLSGLSAETYGGTSSFSYPDELTELGVVWVGDKTSNAGASGVLNQAEILEEKYSWSASVEAYAAAGLSGVVYTKIENGYRGPVRTSVERTYHDAPPTSAEPVSKITPVVGTVTITTKGGSVRNHSSVQGKAGTQLSKSSGGGGSLKFEYDRVVFGPVVHGGVTLATPTPPTVVTGVVNASTGTLPGGGAYYVTSAQAGATGVADLYLPASSSPIASGGSHIIAVNVEKWRMGIWVKEVVTATRP